MEYEGTYPLPEAQKDRFMLKITMQPPDRDQEIILARRTLGSDAPEVTLAQGVVRTLLTADEFVTLRGQLALMTLREELVAYAVDLVRKTRHHESVLVGAGPRATQSLLLASRAKAALSGREFVTPDDIRDMAKPVLEHRVILRPEFEIEGLSPTEVIDRLLREIPVPR